MDPFTGQRPTTSRSAERIAWTMFTVGILVLLLLVLLVTVESLGDPPSVEARPPGAAPAPMETLRPAPERDAERARLFEPSPAERSRLHPCRPGECAVV